ncbi:MAG: hypothetical protein LQ337_008861 [Flavoplaca oasis]|nr:MAG: hypothetical protein LQ337_008861 [Flavoplaca oasis]
MASFSSSNESQPLLGKSLGKACGDEVGRSDVATIEASLVSDSARNFPVDRDQDIGSSSSTSIESEGNSLKGVRDRLKFIFPALAIGIFLAAADQTIIVSSYGRIGSDLQELDETAWLATVYLCTTTASQPLYGKLGDIFGRKPCLLFAYCVFGLGALGCGLALDMNQLIIARAVTNISTRGMITIVSILLSDIVSLEERGIWQGYVNMVFAVGAGLGAPLGGVLTDAIGWRWAFISQAPTCAVAILLVAFLLKLPPRDHHESRQFELARVDFLGATSLVFSLVSLLIFLDRVASDKGQELISCVWMACSAVSFMLFLWVEKQVAPVPLTPLRLLFGKEYLGAYLALAFGNVAWYGVIFYVPLLYQVVGHFSASAAGTSLLPGIFSGVIGGFVGGAVLKRSGGTGFRRLALTSYPLVTLACVGVALSSGLLLSAVPVAAAIVALSISLFVGGLGNGGGMTATLVVVVSVASPADQAVVTACVYLYRQLGATVWLAFISVVFRRVLTASLVQRFAQAPDLGLDMREVVRRVLESLDYLENLPVEARIVVEAAYGDACRAVLIVCSCLAVCAIIFAAFIRERRRAESPLSSRSLGGTPDSDHGSEQSVERARASSQSEYFCS